MCVFSFLSDLPPLPSPPLPSPPLPSPPLPSPSLPLVTERIHSPFQPKQSPSYTSVSSACIHCLSSPGVFLVTDVVIMVRLGFIFLCLSDAVRLSDYNRICPRIQAVDGFICLHMSTLSSILPVNNMYSSSCFQQTCSKLTVTCF